jgi:hypothetical protein
MVPKRFTEKDLLKGLGESNYHADELAEPLPQKLEPLEHRRGQVKRYIRPAEPVWDDGTDVFLMAEALQSAQIFLY